MQMVFVFSLPRSGSTLLQRALMSHPEIHSTSEPWVLLPLAYMLPNKEEIIAPYNHSHAQTALSELIQKLPNKEADYHEAVAKFVENIYAQLSPEGTSYFLDKTPRYYLIIPLIAKLFPDAKFMQAWLTRSEPYRHRSGTGIIELRI